jgi:hypothetical protein
LIDIELFLLLNILGLVFTFLILAFRSSPDEEWKGIAFLCAIVSTVLWLTCAVISVDIGTTTTYASVVDGSLVTGVVRTAYEGTWPLAFVYCLVSVIPFLLLLFLFPDSWKDIFKR